MKYLGFSVGACVGRIENGDVILVNIEKVLPRCLCFACWHKCIGVVKRLKRAHDRSFAKGFIIVYLKGISGDERGET